MDSMVRPYSRAFDILRGAGLRPTRQRLGLARLLFEDGDRHVTAEQLHAESTSANMRVSLATIYNTLNQFSQVGLLREVVVEPGRSYFDTNTTDHHHFFHEETAQLQDIDGAAIVVGPIPEPPSGTCVERVDIIVRVKTSDE
ncbi:MAG: transcriptional repressor [Alphaproteobacteria bacterium]|nr:transcriptional repressor [Alphaproteobacteria bacterium]